MTNGFETRIIDGQYPERKCASIYSKRDLEKWFNLLTMRTSLKHVAVDKDIAVVIIRKRLLKQYVAVSMKRIGEKRCLLWRQVQERQER